MIGILTKVDLVNDPDQLAHIHQQLKNAGAKEIFGSIFCRKTGLQELINYLEEDEV